jgi:hypothetical protein
MPSAIEMRRNFTPVELRRLAAAVLDGINRADAASLGCMDR